MRMGEGVDDNKGEGLAVESKAAGWSKTNGEGYGSGKDGGWEEGLIRQNQFRSRARPAGIAVVPGYSPGNGSSGLLGMEMVVVPHM